MHRAFDWHVHERQAWTFLQAFPVVLAGQRLRVLPKLSTEFLESIWVSRRQRLRQSVQAGIVGQFGVDRHHRLSEADDEVDPLPAGFLGDLLEEVPALLEAEGKELVAQRELAEGSTPLWACDLPGPIKQRALDPL